MATRQLVAEQGDRQRLQDGDLIVTIGRREFVIGATALAAVPAITQAADPTRKLGYAIVGLGYYGLDVIIPEFAKCAHSRLAAFPPRVRACTVGRPRG